MLSPQNKADFYICNKEYRVRHWDGKELIYPFEMFFTLNTISSNTHIVSVDTGDCNLLVHYTEATRTIETVLYRTEHKKDILFKILSGIMNNLGLVPKFRYKSPFSLLLQDNNNRWYYDRNLLLPCLMRTGVCL